jgi:hypothetical protein
MGSLQTSLQIPANPVEFAASLQKIPALLSREFDRKLLIRRAESRSNQVLAPKDSQKSLQISLLAGNRRTETGPIRTASSASKSWSILDT